MTDDANLKAEIEALCRENSRLTAEGIRHQAEIKRMQEAEKAANAQVDMHKARADAAERRAAAAEQGATEAHERAAAAEGRHGALEALVEEHRSRLAEIASERVPTPVEVPVRHPHLHSPALSRPPISVLPGEKRR
jgi:chromosome segregation ATPase